MRRNGKVKLHTPSMIQHANTCTLPGCLLCKRLLPSKLETKQVVKPMFVVSDAGNVLGRLTHTHYCRFCLRTWVCEIEGDCIYDQTISKNAKGERTGSGEWKKHDCFDRLVSVARFIRLQDAASAADNNPYLSRAMEANKLHVTPCMNEYGGTPTHRDGDYCIIPAHKLKVWCINSKGEDVQRSIHVELADRR